MLPFPLHLMIILILGSLFIVLGYLMPRYQLYWLISGLNALPPSELKKYNLRTIERLFGRAMRFIGLWIILIVMAGYATSHVAWVAPVCGGSVFLWVIVVFVGGYVLRNEIKPGA